MPNERRPRGRLGPAGTDARPGLLRIIESRKSFATYSAIRGTGPVGSPRHDPVRTLLAHALAGHRDDVSMVRATGRSVAGDAGESMVHVGGFLLRAVPAVLCGGLVGLGVYSVGRTDGVYLFALAGAVAGLVVVLVQDGFRRSARL